MKCTSILVQLVLINKIKAGKAALLFVLCVGVRVGKGFRVMGLILIYEMSSCFTKKNIRTLYTYSADSFLTLSWLHIWVCLFVWGACKMAGVKCTVVTSPSTEEQTQNWLWSKFLVALMFNDLKYVSTQNSTSSSEWVNDTLCWES